MGNPPLRVETPALNWEPAVVTVPPVPTIPAGGDPMSLMISAIMPELAAPLAAEVAATHAREEQFAANLTSARMSYEATDQSGGEAIRTVSDTQMAPTAAAPSSAGGGGQFGQLMGTAMQTASQAAQVPSQVMGMAAQAPQAAMQVGQGAAQQIGQMAGQFGKSEGAGGPDAQGGGSSEVGTQDPGDHQPPKPQPEQSHEPEDEPKREHEGAGPGSAATERAPESVTPEPVSPTNTYPVASDPVNL